jgi:hypothetical protein
MTDKEYSIKRLCDGAEATNTNSIQYNQRIVHKGKSPRLELEVICNKKEQVLLESFLGFVVEVKYKERWSDKEHMAHARLTEVNKMSYTLQLVLLEFDTILNALKAAGYDHTRMEAEDEKS